MSDEAKTQDWMVDAGREIFGPQFGAGISFLTYHDELMNQGKSWAEAHDLASEKVARLIAAVIAKHMPKEAKP